MPSADDLARLAWQFARRPHVTGAEAAALLALLACNARRCRPTRPDLCRWLAGSVSRTSLYDALAALVADGTVIELPGRRLCLAAMMPAETDAPAETDETEAPHPSAAPDENGAAPPPLSAPSENKSPQSDAKSAAPDASRAHEEAFKSFEKEKAAANAARAREEAVLRRFATEACKLPAAAAEQILATAKAAPISEIRAALEQFHYAYTSGHGTGQSRQDACRNPIGQILDWTRNPHKRDTLPDAALTFARWQQRQASQAGQQERASAEDQRARADERRALGFAQRPRAAQVEALRALREKAPTLAATLPTFFFDSGPGANIYAGALPGRDRDERRAALAAAELLAENLAAKRTTTAPQAA